MNEERRALVVSRAGDRCEYCRAPSYIGTQRFSIEHIIPRSAGGSEDESNLALACQGCNNHKYTKQAAIDPISNAEVPLFHPRQDSWAEHFQWSIDTLQMIGLTAIGRATVAALQLNRNELVRFRRILLGAGEHPPSEDTS